MPDEPTIKEWLGIFQDLYGDVDQHRTPLEVWVAATTHFVRIGEAIRLMDFSKLMDAATHAFCWMATFVLVCRRAEGSVYHISESFCHIVACKYPLVCGHCRDAYCHCNPKLMDDQPNKAAGYEALLRKRAFIEECLSTYTFSQWLDIFNGIYGQHIHMLTLDSIGLHFLEEAGEELAGIRSLVQLDEILQKNIEGVNADYLVTLSNFRGVVQAYKEFVDYEIDFTSDNPKDIKARLVKAKVDVFIEFADTFSWLCSILNKVCSIAKNCKQEGCVFKDGAFSDTLNRVYRPAGKPQCPTCKSFPCRCFFAHRK